MGYRPKEKISTEKSQMAERHEEIFNILSHQRNASQNNSEILSDTCQNVQDQKL